MEAENKWYYLDPTDTQQGPFDTKQMMLWFQNGFFKADLRVRSTFSSSFTTLGNFETNDNIEIFIKGFGLHRFLYPKYKNRSSSKGFNYFFA